MSANGANGATDVMAEDVAVPMLHVSPLHLERLTVPIRGLTPLIVHRFDEKAKRMMLDTMQGKAKPKKAARDPESDYNASRYIIDDERDGFPAVAFKAAIVGAARMFDKSVTMAALKSLIFVHGEGPEMLVPVDGQRTMREDYVRLGGTTTDLRYRAQYDNWKAELVVEFPGSQITAESVLALIEAGGFGGVGEWRPSAPKGLTGIYGRFCLDG
jgi:hypothetical protein